MTLSQEAQDYVDEAIREVGVIFEREDAKAALSRLLELLKENPETAFVLDNNRALVLIMGFGLGGGEGMDYLGPFIRGFVEEADEQRDIEAQQATS